jgi:hypothetical protein
MCLVILLTLDIQTKQKFDGTQPQNKISFGRNYDNDDIVSRGSFFLSDKEVASTFDNVVAKITESFLTLVEDHKVKVCETLVKSSGHSWLS